MRITYDDWLELTEQINQNGGPTLGWNLGFMSFDSDELHGVTCSLAFLELLNNLLERKADANDSN